MRAEAPGSDESEPVDLDTPNQIESQNGALNDRLLEAKTHDNVDRALWRATLKARLRSRLFDTNTRGPQVGRYTILHSLGQGGMGTVFAAHDSQLDRRVALKVVKEPRNKDARARMLREAQALARFSHPNVVSVFEVGEQDQRLFVAMEYVEGDTLSAWLHERPRTWREVVDVFLQAGQGVAAVHQAGLFHRDFKPTNVMVGKDGRVRVVDFGLATSDNSGARIDKATKRSADSLTDTLDTSLTAPGTIMGTPAYMSPEQLAGAKLDPSSDQFSYCVALWEALYGSRPFGGTTTTERLVRTKQAQLEPIEQPCGPASLRPVLERGLRFAPRERWPDLNALLRELRRIDTKPSGRRLMLWVGASLLAIAFLALGIQRWSTWSRGQALDHCHQLATQATRQVWDDHTAERVRAGLLASGVGHAQQTADKSIPWLTDYAAELQAAHTEVCIGVEVDERTSGDERDRAIWCLERRSDALRALVEQLVHADTVAVNRAVGAAASLARVDICRAPPALRRLPAPPSPDKRAAVLEVRAQLSDAHALEVMAKYEEGLAAARSAEALARTLAQPSVHAAALVSLGELLDHVGAYDDAEARLLDGYFMAVRAHDSRTAARASTKLLFLLGFRLQRPTEATKWSRHAAAALDELGVGPADLRRARYLNSLALLHRSKGEFHEAKAIHERVLEVQGDALRPDHPHIAQSLNNLGIVLYSLGNYDEAEARYLGALKIWKEVLGPDHPKVAMVMSNLGVVYQVGGDSARAKAMFEQSLATMETILGPEHPDLAVGLNNLGQVAYVAKDYAKAKALFERAVELKERALGANDPSVASFLVNVGRATNALGDPAGAKATYHRALRIQEASLGPDNPALGSTLDYLARMHFEEGEFEEAGRRFERSATLAGAALGIDHPRTTRAAANVGLARYMAGDHVGARQAWGTAMQDRARELAPLGSDAESVALHEQALSAMDATFGLEHRLAANILHTIGRVHFNAQRHALAVQALTQAASIRTEALGLGDPRTIETADLLHKARVAAHEHVLTMASEGLRHASAISAEMEAWFRE